MRDLIVAAFDRVRQGVIEPNGLRNDPPAWAEPLLRAADDWLTGMTAVHVEVAIDGGFDLEEDFDRATITVITENVVAQTVVESPTDRNIFRGQFTEWRIVPDSEVIALEWVRVRATYGPGHYDQLRVEFNSLDPVVVPSNDSGAALEAESAKALFFRFRDAWIARGGSAFRP